MDIVAVWEMVRPWWLVWLVIFFAAIVFWAYRPCNRRRFEDDGMIPFKDGNDGE